MTRSTARHRLPAAVAAVALVTLPGAGPASAGNPAAPATALSCAGGWSQVYVPYPLVTPPLATGTLGSVAALSDRDVWFAGRAPNPIDPGFDIELQHYDGRTISDVAHPRVGSYWDLYDLNNSHNRLSFDSPSDGWLVGSYMMTEEVWVDDQASAQVFPSHPLVEHWNGHRWVLTPMEVQPDARFDAGTPTSVFALSPTDAWLVGAGAGLHALIEHWDGRRWRIVPQPGAGLTRSVLYSVSGTSARDLWAVGRYFADDGTERTLIEHWDGRGWTQVPSPNVAGDALDALASVSADSTGDAWAVGSRIATLGRDRQVSLVEHWDGHRWSIVPSLDAPAGSTGLVGVLALSPTDVHVVGGSGPQHWDGHLWTGQPVTADPAYSASYLGLGTAGGRDLWLAGYLDTSSVLAGGRVNQPLVLHRCQR
jgi:hypothetical protein